MKRKQKNVCGWVKVKKSKTSKNAKTKYYVKEFSSSAKLQNFQQNGKFQFQEAWKHETKWPEQAWKLKSNS